LVSHDFTAFSKFFSEEEKKNLTEFINKLLIKINNILKKKNENSISLNEITSISSKDLIGNEVFSGKVLKLNKHISICLNPAKISSIINFQLGNKKEIETNYDEGKLGKKIIINYFQSLFDTFNFPTDELLLYTEIKEWGLTQSAVSYFLFSFVDKNNNENYIFIDQVHKNWLLSLISNAS
jgi:hypothetical protein